MLLLQGLALAHLCAGMFSRNTHLAHCLACFRSYFPGADATFLGQRSLGAPSHPPTPHLPLSHLWQLTYQVFSLSFYCSSPGVECKLLGGWDSLIRPCSISGALTSTGHTVRVQCSTNE